MARQSKHIRFQVAHKAAQMMAEEGISDYAFAKRKAAKFFGLMDDALPSNDEIKNALKMYQSIYIEEQKTYLKKLRLKSLNLMKKFNEFNPYLVGNIAEGIINKYPIINIELRTDSIKELGLFLINNAISYDTKDINIKSAGSREKRSIISFEIDGLIVELYIKPIENVKKNSNQYSLKELEKIITAE